ncbi:hypothetical protein MPTK1_4g06210 [Marchantia polymorpha subsp. ruderalis]|nr:hypothetical protein MARPO_0114s0032 [Marchantia polymorpha]BBN07757.1 hypothetical protein Mp_4g06210 [Marchantia polymorpha subsp. ruderalis]|eukprot:PTQ31215.1 hypothetical protein MARPO_0114s0032 [Marchantia polymorpha]
MRRRVIHLFWFMVFVVLPASIGAFFFIVSCRMFSTSGGLPLENSTLTDSSRSLKSSGQALSDFLENKILKPIGHENHYQLSRIASDQRLENGRDPASGPLTFGLKKSDGAAESGAETKQSRILSVSTTSSQMLHEERPSSVLASISTRSTTRPEGSGDVKKPIVVDLERQHEHSSIEASEEVDEPLTPSDLTAPQGPQEWLEFPLVDNETAYLLEPFNRVDKSGCLNVRTSRIQIMKGPPGFIQPSGGGSSSSKRKARVRLAAGSKYEVILAAISNDGKQQCVGGDYFETDLQGPKWKSRPPVLDHNNGTYSITFQIHPRFAGAHNFTIILLFANYEGLNRNPARWARQQIVLSLEIDFVLPEVIHTVADTSWISKMLRSASLSSLAPPSSSSSLKLRLCQPQDFERKYWTGRWTKEEEYECPMDEQGKVSCRDPDALVEEVWSEGLLSSLKSDGWVYSAHCAFRIFSEDEAWKCLNNKWLYFWGDSNMEDTITNLLNSVLGFKQSLSIIPRVFDKVIDSPNDGGKYSVRITNIFNGHHEVERKWEGLSSLLNPQYQTFIRSHFQNDTAPDFLIMNSGLHDGMYWKKVEQFLHDGVEHTWRFWDDVWKNMKAERPKIIYRSTVAAGGQQRILSMNPQKMEFYNHLLQDRLSQLNPKNLQFIDAFDITFPWHYDHVTNDGLHYGRPPANIKSFIAKPAGYKNFVDLMLGHVYLNAICGA